MANGTLAGKSRSAPFGPRKPNASPRRISNGASIERLNWLGDPSEHGRKLSAGIMANYLYEPDHIAERAEAYSAHGEETISGEIRELLAE